MFKNYFKVAFRNLLQNKLYTFVNILGLSVAIAFCVVAYLNQTYNYMFNEFHTNADEIYQVKMVRLFNGEKQSWGATPRPLAPALAADFPAIKRTMRLTRSSAVIRHGDNVFNETILHVDPDFFEMFDFPVKYGSVAALQDKSNLILSEELAHKYFGDTNPVGKHVTLRYRDEKPRSFLIGAVLNEIPDHSSIQFDALAQLEILFDIGQDKPNNWADWAHTTFVQVSDPTQLATIRDKMRPYADAHNSVATDFEIVDFYFDPLRDLALKAWQQEINGDILKRAMHPAGMISPTIIATLLLLMACFNYINTSIAFSSKRLKEIGVRKVIGGLRRQLITQFMLENILMCTMALIVGMCLAEVFVPIHDSMWVYFELTLEYSENLGLLAFLAGLLLLVAVVAGAYPAIYISRYNPVKILRGQQKFGRNSWFSRGLLTFQFFVSILTLISSLIFIRNADFLKNIDLGFNKDQVIVVPLLAAKNYQPYHDVVARNSDIIALSGSEDHIGWRWRTQTVESASQKSKANILDIGPDYLKTMDVSFASGRGFEQEFATDVEASLVINQKLAGEFGWDDPLGQTVTLDSTRHTVIGMVEDFYTNGVWRPIRAVAFRLIEPEKFRYMAVRVQPENLIAASEFLRSEWQRLFPDLPYEGFFQDEVMAEAINVSDSLNTMFMYISVLAIVIAAMGLFALVSLNIARRIKEIGIRKVLGASVLNVMNLVNKEFWVLLFVAAILASVVGYYAMQAMMSSIYSYHVGFSVMPFLWASLVIFAVALLTVGSQVIKVALANPVEALRYE